MTYFKKLVKQQDSSAKIYVYIDSESQIILYLVGITKMTYFLLILVKKAQDFIDS